jgi:HSP20 family protein
MAKANFQSSPIFTFHLDPNESAPALAHPVNFDKSDRDWEDGVDGQLALDVLETDQEIIIIAPMAGAITDNIEVFIQHDLLTIRGMRQNPANKFGQSAYIYKESFWGPFSRSVVLPVEVKGEVASAEYRQGVLTIHIPKKTQRTAVPVKVVEE